MKNQRDKLHQYQRKITVLTSRETAIAKSLLAENNKAGALLALRRKKYQESLLAKTDAQLEQLEKLTASVEFAQVQRDVLFGLQQGTKVLNEIHKEMGGLDHVEKLMGESEEARAYQRVYNAMVKILGSSRTDDVSRVTGSQRDVGRTHLKPGRGRSRGRAGRSRGRGHRSQVTRGSYGTVTGERSSGRSTERG